MNNFYCNLTISSRTDHNKPLSEIIHDTLHSNFQVFERQVASDISAILLGLTR